MNPGRLTCLVSFTIFFVLKVWHFGAEHILPRLVEIELVLNVQDNIVLSFFFRFLLRYLLFVNELDQILYLAIKHYLKYIALSLLTFFVLHQIICVRFRSRSRTESCSHFISYEGALRFEHGLLSRFYRVIIISHGLHRLILHRRLLLLFISSFFPLPVISILYPCQQYRVVLANVFFLSDSDLITLVIDDGLEHATRVQILFLAERHGCEENLQLVNEFHA